MDEAAARRKSARRGVLVAVWLVIWPLVVWTWPAEVGTLVGCLPADPDGGLLSDHEPCRGDDWALLRLFMAPLFIWCAVGASLLWWAVTPARAAAPDR